MKSPKNIPASVRQRILNRAKSNQRPFNELLQYYAMERFLYRLSQSAHADRFILKGALMLRVWRSPELRPTMDIDMLGRTSNKEADIIAQIRDILSMDVEADGLAFDADSIQTERITEDADYEGIRFHSGKSRLRWMDFSRQLSRPFPPANQVAQTGSHPAHGPEPMDSHQEEHPQSFFTRTDNIKGLKGSPIHQEAKNL